MGTETVGGTPGEDVDDDDDDGTFGSCDEAAEVEATLSVDIGNYPHPIGPTGCPEDYELTDLSCTVTTLDVAPPSVTTELECEVPDADPETIVVSHTAETTGGPTWAEGDPVLLSATKFVLCDLNDIQHDVISLRAADGTLLLAGADVNTFDEDVPSLAAFASPVGIEVDGQACGGDSEDSVPAGVTVTFGGVEHDSLGPSEADYEIEGRSYAVRIGRASFGSFGESELLLDVIVVGQQQ